MWRLLRYLKFLMAVLGLSVNIGSDRDNPIMAGLVDVQKETIEGKVKVDSGIIPDWLNGNFIRHGCAIFGNTRMQNLELPNYVEHLFDCVPMGTRFKLEKGEVTFTNRYYDTVVNDIYNIYARNMNKSSVFQSTAYSKTNKDQIKRWKKNMTEETKVVEVPNVSWWKVGNQVVAMTEMPVGVVVDPHSVTQKGHIDYKDDNLGYDKAVMFTNNPAHEHTEKDGTVWSVFSAVDMKTMPNLKIWRVIYKVGADRVRHVVGEYHFKAADITQCSRSPPFSPYPNYESRFGYMHSFAMTENYVILPETAYMHDPCAYTHFDNTKPFFSQFFTYEKDGYSRLLVMRKSDGVFVASIKTPPFFATHQLGSYEEGPYIHMDMLTYDDAGIYTKYTYVNSMMSDDMYTTEVKRITIDTRDWTASFLNLRKGPPTAFEMSNINYAYNGKKYSYAYMVKNFIKSEQNAITKLNVDTGFETEYVFDMGLFPQEPQFVPSPSQTAEDDGVILSQGVDGNLDKAFLTIIDAKTMKLIAHVTAPGSARLGLHNKFFGLDEGV